VRTCASEGIKTNVTLCFSATQALLAAKAGASYISPFVGRLDDVATNGMELVREIVEIYDNYEFPTEVLVASCRHPMHVIEAAKMAPRNSPELAMVYEQEKQKGNANRATLAVARKLVAYLVAVDRRQKEFLTVERENRTAA